MNNKLRVYAHVWKIFGDNAFSLDDFKNAFHAPNARKTLSDLSKDGFIERRFRGSYRAVNPMAFVAGIAEESKQGHEVPNESGLPYAFADKDAVLIWTEGYYWSGFKAGYFPIVMEINKSDVEKWKKFFQSKNAAFFIEGAKPRETFAGTVYVLRSKGKIQKTKKGRYWTVPLKKTIAFCKDNPYMFEPALEYLDKKYKVGLMKAYHYINR